MEKSVNWSKILNYESIAIKEQQRIQWIDIAKGITIFLGIIGYTAPFGILERNMIFSFHMPLFYFVRLSF